MVKSKVELPIVVLIMGYIKVANVENQEIYYVELNLRKCIVCDNGRKRSFVNMIHNFRNDISPNDASNYMRIIKKRVLSGFMIAQTSTSKDQIFIRVVKSRINNSQVSRITSSRE